MRRSWLLLAIWLGIVILLAEAMPLIVQHYAATDNVRELFRTDRSHVLRPHTWFLMLCLLVPTSAALAARLLLQRRYLPPALIALAAPVAGWFCLRFAVTVESMHDILGSMLLGWPYDLEYIARFSIVFGALWTITLLGFLPSLLAAGGERISGGRSSGRRNGKVSGVLPEMQS